MWYRFASCLLAQESSSSVCYVFECESGCTAMSSSPDGGVHSTRNTIRPRYKRISLLALASVIVALGFFGVTVLGPYMGLEVTAVMCVPVLGLIAIAYVVVHRGGTTHVRGRFLVLLAVAITVMTVVASLVLNVTATTRIVSLSRDRGSVTCEPYEWASTRITRQLPKVDAPSAEIQMNDDQVVRAYMCGVSRTEYDAYVKAVQLRGFHKIRITDDTFYGENNDGYTLFLEYSDLECGVMTIYADDESGTYIRSGK